MPRLDENTQEFLEDAERGVRQGTSRAWDSFSDFALRDNVLEVAVGLIVRLVPSFPSETLHPSYRPAC
jgi:large conductance mechanosensitive channel